MSAEATRTDPIDAIEPWAVDLADFPPDAGTDEVFRFAVRYGCLAPSSHNSQPWLFRIHDAALDVIGDTARGLAVADPHDRELVMSCGAAIENITLALTRLGYRSRVDVLPDPRDPELYARIHLAGPVEPTDADIRLFDQIARRRTSRAAFDRRPLPDELVTRLRSDAAHAGASLHVVAQERVAEVTELIVAADHVQMADPRFRRELITWLTGTRRRDGMPSFAIEIGNLRLPQFATPLVVRTFDIGKGRAAWDRQLIDRSGLLAVISTRADDVPSWLRAGRAMQAVLLRARAHDVWGSFLNQPIEVDALRQLLATVIGDGTPQLLLRLGYGPEPEPTNRRDPDDLFVE